MDHIRIFGSLAFGKTQTKKRSGYQKKLEERATKGILVGYELDHTYRIYNLSDNKIIITRDIEFDEHQSAHTDATYDIIDEFIINNGNKNPIENAEANISEEIANEPTSYKQAISSSDATNWIKAMED